MMTESNHTSNGLFSKNEDETMRTPERKKKKGPPRTTPKKWADDRSNDASSGAPSAAPSSVMVGPPLPLTRDLSDLSGSYLNGNTAPRGANRAQVPGSVYQSDQSATSYERPWRHAKVLSSKEPIHPQPHDDGDSAGFIRKAMVMPDRHGVVEVVQEQDDDMTFNTMEEHHRSPMLILLMDPGRKIYELMQLWIDVSTDTVRDVLCAVQQNLSDKWRQDYDGLFSVRGKNFNQLIHILNVAKYEIQPHEIWVAKPWSMSANGTVGYAGDLLNHLRGLGILAPVSNPRWKFVRPRAEDVILALSKAAQARVYVPGGIFKHHHASQYLTFVPPFEACVRVDVLGSDQDEGSATSTMSASEGKRSTPSLSPTRDKSIETALKLGRPKNYFRNRRVSDNKRVDAPFERESRGSLIRALSSLNCSCTRSRRDGRYGGMGNRVDSDTMLDMSDVGTMWKVYEEEMSIVSESAPLLMSPPKSDWLTPVNF